VKILCLPSDVGHPGLRLPLGAKEPLGPCAQYRIKYPFEALSVQTEIEVEWGVYPLDYVWEYAREFDVVVFQRHVELPFRSLVEHCRLFLKKKVVWDIDDVLLHLDRRNHLAYRWWGDDPEGVWEAHLKSLEKASLNDPIRRLTKKQVLYLAQENRRGAEWMLQNVDLVTCTTQVIKDTYSNYTDNIVVLPNSIRVADWENVVPKRLPECAGKTVIGWAGGESHAADLQAMSGAIARTLRKFPEAVFVIVGYPKAKEFFPDDVPVFTVPWCEIDEYRGWVGGFDIGIAPSQKILTNQAKSGIRIYEYALAKPEGMAVVANPWPYKDDVHKGMGTVAFNDQKFEKALTRYIRDKDLRAEHSKALREHVLSEHTMEQNVWKWEKVYAEFSADNCLD
jgi:hypothetical protein